MRDSVWELRRAAFSTRRHSADHPGMEATLGIMIDRFHGIEYRAMPHRDRRGWFAQWRPARAIESFPAFSYISRTECFETESEAMEFIRRNAADIVARRI
jgi:hypothetical protein